MYLLAVTMCDSRASYLSLITAAESKLAIAKFIGDIKMIQEAWRSIRSIRRDYNASIR
ncbi:hypothetical protein VL73_58 [Erwinia phage VL73]